MITLEDFKPKSIDEETIALLYEKDCCIMFQDSTWVILKNTLIDSFPLSFIKIKDLFKGEYDNAILCNQELKQTFIFPKNIELISIPINDLDLSVFSSIASSDSDLFWSSILKLDKEKNSFELKVAGLVYAIEYTIPKINIDFDLSFSLCWSGYYYMYKLFKHVTKKKLGTLKIGLNDNKIFITDENEELFFIFFQDNASVQYKLTSLMPTFDYITLQNWNTRDIVSKKLLTSSSESLVKHLAKPFKDNISYFDNQQMNKYTDNLYYNLYIFKKR